MVVLAVVAVLVAVVVVLVAVVVLVVVAVDAQPVPESHRVAAAVADATDPI